MNDDVIISHDLFRQNAGSNYPELKQSIQYSRLFNSTLGRDIGMLHGIASSFHLALSHFSFLPDVKLSPSASVLSEKVIKLARL